MSRVRNILARRDRRDRRHRRGMLLRDAAPGPLCSATVVHPGEGAGSSSPVRWTRPSPLRRPRREIQHRAHPCFRRPPLAAPLPPVERGRRRPAGLGLRVRRLGRPAAPAAASSTAPWYAVETYYLKLVNCTRTGGWVRADGSCAGYGSGHYSAYVPPLELGPKLSAVSRSWAKHLAVVNACSHRRPGPAAAQRRVQRLVVGREHRLRLGDHHQRRVRGRARLAPRDAGGEVKQRRALEEHQEPALQPRRASGSGSTARGCGSSPTSTARADRPTRRVGRTRARDAPPAPPVG